MLCGWAVLPTLPQALAALHSLPQLPCDWLQTPCCASGETEAQTGFHAELETMGRVWLWCQELSSFASLHLFELVTCSAVRLADDTVPAFLGTLAGDLIWLESCSSYQPSLLFFSLLVPAVSIAADTKYGGFWVGKCV